MMTIAKTLEGERVVKLQGVRRHGSATTIEDGRARSRVEGGGSGRALSGAVSRSEDASTSVDHPIADL